MKKEITTVCLTLATVLGFAQETSQELAEANLVQLEINPSLPALEEKKPANHSFGYLRMGVSDSHLPRDTEQMLPGLGMGYRIVSGSSAFDLSASFNRRNYQTNEGKNRTYQYTLPKANYFYYVTATKSSSLYGGGGFAWGGMKTEDGREFSGLIPNLALGLEMNRNAAWRSFFQLDVSQPALAATQKGDLPKAFAELTLGSGF